MAMRPRKWLDRVTRERAYRGWADLARSKLEFGLSRQRSLRDEALALRRKLDLFLMRTDQRRDLARESLDALHLPEGTDWRWRPVFMTSIIRPTGIAAPENGERLGEQAAVWHDCPERALILEQIENLRATDLSPFGLRLEVFGFSGSYLSVSIDLPDRALDGLTREHILRLETGLVLERDMNVYARLNVANGPNTDQVLHQIANLAPGTQHQQVIEFDLAYTAINEKRLEKIWIDLIFEAPYMNALDIRELFVSRHLRADF